MKLGLKRRRATLLQVTLRMGLFTVKNSKINSCIFQDFLVLLHHAILAAVSSFGFSESFKVQPLQETAFKSTIEHNV